MTANVHEIADGIFRLSTYVPEIAPPLGFTFNQFLVMAEEPLLFHCGHRAMFDGIAEAVKSLMPIEKLRWISFSHFEADECAAMNDWLRAAPAAQIAHGRLGCDISLNDLAQRTPRALDDMELIDLGGKKVRFLATPHVPHGWDSGLMFEEQTKTLLCSDILGHLGHGPAIGSMDVVTPALEAEEMFKSMSVTAETIATLRRLAALQPRTLALMHGSSFGGDGAAVLNAFADGLADARLRQAA